MQCSGVSQAPGRAAPTWPAGPPPVCADPQAAARQGSRRGRPTLAAPCWPGQMSAWRGLHSREGTLWTQLDVFHVQSHSLSTSVPLPLTSFRLQLVRVLPIGHRPQVRYLPGGACTLKACQGHCAQSAACVCSTGAVPHNYIACISGTRESNIQEQAQHRGHQNMWCACSRTVIPSVPRAQATELSGCQQVR